MIMDVGSAIIGAIIILSTTVPFLILGRNKKKSEKRFVGLLSKIAAEHNCQIHKHEIFGNRAIGIDEAKNFVFFYKQVQDNTEEQWVDLSKIKSCMVINTSRTIKSKDGNQKVLDKLELSFIPTAKDKPEIKLEFFNADVTGQVYEEFMSIDKWSKLINSRLRSSFLV